MHSARLADDFLGAGTVVPAPTFSVVRGVNVTKVDASVNLPLTFADGRLSVGPFVTPLRLKPLYQTAE